jgi:hypothetical protein
MREAARINERLVGVALAGGIALNFPLLYLFSGHGRVLGIPVLFLYLFLVWGGIIGLVALSLRSSRRERARGELVDDERPRA